MKLIFERGNEGQYLGIVPKSDVPVYEMPQSLRRTQKLDLPHVSENELSRHYTEIAKRVHGVNDGFYPLGSCTMKYNPKINEELASLKGFTKIHPKAPDHAVQGCLEVLAKTEEYLAAISGMDAVTLQGAAGAHGEFTGLLLIKAYLEAKGETNRTKIIVPDSAHGTNPASAVMCGFTIVNIPSNADGCVDLDALRGAVGEDTAGLMLTNPNTVGVFDKNILEITKLVHEAGAMYVMGCNPIALAIMKTPAECGADVAVGEAQPLGIPLSFGGPYLGYMATLNKHLRKLPGRIVGQTVDT